MSTICQFLMLFFCFLSLTWLFFHLLSHTHTLFWSVIYIKFSRIKIPHYVVEFLFSCFVAEQHTANRSQRPLRVEWFMLWHGRIKHVLSISFRSICYIRTCNQWSDSIELFVFNQWANGRTILKHYIMLFSFLIVRCFFSLFFFANFCLFFFPLYVNVTAHGLRTKRQSDETSTKKDESFEQELCKGKDAGEWFRLVAGEGDNCRDVIQCTSSVSRTTFNSSH